jgi:hypothetical protein
MRWNVPEYPWTITSPSAISSAFAARALVEQAAESGEGIVLGAWVPTKSAGATQVD